MYDTNGTRSICRPSPADYDVQASLTWLASQLARDEQRGGVSRRTREGEQVIVMRRPLTSAQAYARFGMLMGLLPPAAIFFRMFGGRMGAGLHSSSNPFPVWLLLCLAMNVTCCVVGCAMGAALFRQVDVEVSNFERRSWAATLFASLLLAFAWAVVTGAAGGALFFGFGALFGAACAVPVALLGFSAFTSLHRLLARGGMIEASQLWPLAFGVPAVIAALILSPFVVPY
ncbi:MAG: hypothetical protein LC754_03920 [Acidobacteria bacterium]|nr:hypothetical protein [Acidobacteriota bacterium]